MKARNRKKKAIINNNNKIKRGSLTVGRHKVYIYIFSVLDLVVFLHMFNPL